MQYGNLIQKIPIVFIVKINLQHLSEDIIAENVAKFFVIIV
jgi:hypothetical protein